MTELKAFLAGNALPVPNKRVAISKRFLDEDGQPMKWELRAITIAEDEALRKSYTETVPAPGKAGRRGQVMSQLKGDAYALQFVAACVVFPNLNDAELQDSYGVKGDAPLLQAMLTPGELNDLTYEAQSHCGFDISLEDKVEEAKN